MPRDWNDIDSEDEQGSEQNPLSDNEQQKSTPSRSKEPQSHPSDSRQDSSQQQSNTNNTQNTASSKKEYHHSSTSAPKFFTDQQLIDKIQDKTLDERRKIKIVKCHSEELLELLRYHKLITDFREVKVENRPSIYFASFKTEEDTVEFIKEKMQNNYRFFINPYYKSAKDIEREERRKQRNYDNQNHRETKRQQKHYRGTLDSKARDYGGNDRHRKAETEERSHTRNRQGGKKPRNRPQYDEEQQEEIHYGGGFQKKQQFNSSKTTKFNKKQTSQELGSKNEFNFSIDKNIVTIYGNKYSKNRIIDEIIDKQVTKNWNRIKIYVKPQGIDKVYQLCQLFYEKIGYGLEKLPQIPEKTGTHNDSSQKIEVIIKENCHIKPPNVQYILLGNNENKYFDDIKGKNKYRITKDWNLEAYIKGFKANKKEITKQWKVWVLKAQGDLIETLLDLSWALKRETGSTVDMKVGTEQKEQPFCILSIEMEEQKEKRPTVNASCVNSYLTTD